MRFLLVAVLALSSTALAAQTTVVEEALPGVRFSKPVQVVALQAEQRYYIVEQGDGNARPELPPRILTLAPSDTEPTLFLDLEGRVAAIGGETGLLGLAFHPDYQTNGRFFVHYTARPSGSGLMSRISEFSRSATNVLEADPESERIVLEADQPASNHNGGSIDFGPDGFLYIAIGDGGGADDQFQNGQDTTTLLGAISRIDVDNVPDGAAYGIPSDNPFAQTDGPERDEIFAYGLRNPFKMDVSRSGVWVGDVGQNKWEEVNRVEAGGNYGWNTVEGPECFQGRSCDLDAFEPPFVFYDHGPTGGVSITGGYVIEGADFFLASKYVYGDFGSGRIWAVDIFDPEPTVILEPGENGLPFLLISSIDPDLDPGNVLVTSYADRTGTIYRLRVEGGVALEDDPAASGPTLALAGANPFRTSTAVALEADGPARVTVLDVLGREVAVLWDGPGVPARLDLEGENLAPGLYTVRVQTSRAEAILRVVRAR